MRIERPPLPLACNDAVNLLSIILIQCSPESNFVDTRDGPESPKSPIEKSPSQNSLRNASLSYCQKENVCCVPGWKVQFPEAFEAKATPPPQRSAITPYRIILGNIKDKQSCGSGILADGGLDDLIRRVTTFGIVLMKARLGSGVLLFYCRRRCYPRLSLASST